MVVLGRLAMIVGGVSGVCYVGVEGSYGGVEEKAEGGGVCYGGLCSCWRRNVRRAIRRGRGCFWGWVCGYVLMVEGGSRGITITIVREDSNDPQTKSMKIRYPAERRFYWKRAQ